MAVFVCKECGAEREGRCKPRKCAACGNSGTFEKKEDTQQGDSCDKK